MQHQEQYSLTWQSYSDHLRDALRDMMTSSEFADVILVTDDKQQIRAHRNILSACSPVFKKILQIDCNNANPVIYLRGIQHSEIESIIQFIYLGEARFYYERMSELIQVSKDLEIKELSTGIPTDSNEQHIEHKNNADEDIGDDSALTVKEDANVEYQTSNRPITRYNAANKKVSRTEGVNYACNQCDKKYTRQYLLTTHIQSAHEGIMKACNQCDYQAAPRRSCVVDRNLKVDSGPAPTKSDVVSSNIVRFW